MDIAYYGPFLMVIVFNVCYHLMSKNFPANSNPFLGLGVTYGVACILSALMFVATRKQSVSEEISRLNILYVLMGIAVLGMEAGFLLMYRNGWSLSTGSLSTNISVAIILFLIGTFVFKEGVTVKKLAGVAACIAGIFLINA